MKKTEIELIKEVISNLDGVLLSFEVGRADRAYEDTFYCKNRLEKILKDRNVSYPKGLSRIEKRIFEVVNKP